MSDPEPIAWPLAELLAEAEHNPCIFGLHFRLLEPWWLRSQRSMARKGCSWPSRLEMGTTSRLLPVRPSWRHAVNTNTVVAIFGGRDGRCARQKRAGDVDRKVDAMPSLRHAAPTYPHRSRHVAAVRELLHRSRARRARDLSPASPPGLPLLLAGSASRIRQPAAHFHRIRLFLVLFDDLGSECRPLLRNDQEPPRARTEKLRGPARQQ